MSICVSTSMLPELVYLNFDFPIEFTLFTFLILLAGFSVHTIRCRYTNARWHTVNQTTMFA